MVICSTKVSHRISTSHFLPDVRFHSIEPSIDQGYIVVQERLQIMEALTQSEDTQLPAGYSRGSSDGSGSGGSASWVDVCRGSPVQPRHAQEEGDVTYPGVIIMMVSECNRLIFKISHPRACRLLSFIAVSTHCCCEFKYSHVPICLMTAAA